MYLSRETGIKIYTGLNTFLTEVYCFRIKNINDYIVFLSQTSEKCS